MNIDASKSIAVLFIVLILTPSIFVRFGFECIRPLKERKLTLHENTIWFLLPASIAFIVFNGVLLNIPILEHYRIRTSAFFDLSFLTLSGNFRRFIAWYICDLCFCTLVGIITAKIFIKIFANNKTDRIGKNITDQSWSEVFKNLHDENKERRIYIKTKDGEIYTGIFKNYSFDYNNKLELIILDKAIRNLKIDNCSLCSKEIPEKEKMIDLSFGRLVIPESDISNIWFQLGIATKTINRKKFEDIVKGLNLQSIQAG